MTQNRHERGISDELLQRYFDDAVSSEERADVEARLDDDARLRLDALAELRGVLRERTYAEASGIDFSSTIDAISRTAIPVAPKRRALIPLSAVGGFLAAAVAVFILWQPMQSHKMHAERQTNDAEVESLEVEGAVATVFRVQDGTDPSHTATVIWTEDDEGAAGTDAVRGGE